MAKVQEIGPYSAYAIAVKYGYKGTEEEWVQEQEANRKAAEAAAAAAEQSAKNAAATAANVTQSGQQAVQNIQNAQTTALQAIDTAKQQAVQAAQAEAEKAATSAGQAAASAAEAAQSATNAAAEVGKVQNAGTAAVQSVQAAQNTATEAVSDAQQTATQAVSEAQTTAVSAVQAEGTTQTSAVDSAASSALTDISGAKDAALSAVAEAGAAQVSAVGTAGTGAVQDVNDAKTAALKEIDAANAALPSPTQSDAGKVPTVKADASAYELAGPYAPLSAAIRPTASGNPVNITDSVEWPLQGLKVYGKSTQDGTPSPESPVPIVSAGNGGSVTTQVRGANLLSIPDTNKTFNGITFISSGGIVKISGTSTAEASMQVNLDLPVGTYYISGNVSAGHCRVVYKYNSEDSYTYCVGPASFTLIKPTYMFLFQLIVSNDNTVDETVYPMINVGSTALPWEPYKSQSLTLSTPSGLPGIPVDSGGNYTDADGQRRWVDVIDYSNEKKYQYINEVVVDGTNVKFTPNSGGQYWNLPGNSAPSVIQISKTQINKYFPSNVFMANENHDFIFTMPQNMAPYFETIEELNAFCVQKNTEGNPLTIMYVMDTPIETPLSEEEIAAYRALHTYDGATVVSTAEDVAGLEVKYLADGEKYVERIVSQKASEAAAAHTMALLADGIRDGVNGA